MSSQQREFEKAHGLKSYENLAIWAGVQESMADKDHTGDFWIQQVRDLLAAVRKRREIESVGLPVCKHGHRHYCGHCGPVKAPEVVVDAPLRVPTFPGGPWVYLRSWTQGADGWRREPLHGNPHAISAVNGSGVCWGVGEEGAPALPPFIVYGETAAECAAKLDARLVGLGAEAVAEGEWPDQWQGATPEKRPYGALGTVEADNAAIIAASARDVQ